MAVGPGAASVASIIAVGPGAASVASIMAVGSGAAVASIIAVGSGAGLVAVGAGAVGVSSSPPQATATTARTANRDMKTNHLGFSNQEYVIAIPP